MDKGADGVHRAEWKLTKFLDLSPLEQDNAISLANIIWKTHRDWGEILKIRFEQNAIRIQFPPLHSHFAVFGSGYNTVFREILFDQSTTKLTVLHEMVHQVFGSKKRPHGNPYVRSMLSLVPDDWYKFLKKSYEEEGFSCDPVKSHERNEFKEEEKEMIWEKYRISMAKKKGMHFGKTSSSK